MNYYWLLTWYSFVKLNCISGRLSKVRLGAHQWRILMETNVLSHYFKHFVQVTCFFCVWYYFCHDSFCINQFRVDTCFIVSNRLKTYAPTVFELMYEGSKIFWLKTPSEEMFPRCAPGLSSVAFRLFSPISLIIIYLNFFQFYQILLGAYIKPFE